MVVRAELDVELDEVLASKPLISVPGLEQDMKMRC